jgi:RecA/RadA recombinase
MQSALEQYNTQGYCLKMSTGSGELDSLIDGIQEGLFYLFYGDSLPLTAFSNRLLVNCVKSTKEHGFESMALCVNNTDYYGRGKILLNPENIANAAKAASIDPKIVSKNLLVQTAYNPNHQVQVAKEVADLIETNQDIKLVVINNLTKFFKDSSSQRRPENANAVKETISIINRACAKNKVSIVVTGDANVSSRGIIPRPIGGTYLKHLATVIVYFKDISNSFNIRTCKATVVKHQYVRTPQSVIIHGRRAHGTMLLN